MQSEGDNSDSNTLVRDGFRKKDTEMAPRKVKHVLIVLVVSTTMIGFYLMFIKPRVSDAQKLGWLKQVQNMKISDGYTNDDLDTQGSRQDRIEALKAKAKALAAERSRLRGISKDDDHIINPRPEEKLPEKDVIRNKDGNIVGVKLYKNGVDGRRFRKGEVVPAWENRRDHEAFLQQQAWKDEFDAKHIKLTAATDTPETQRKISALLKRIQELEASTNEEATEDDDEHEQLEKSDAKTAAKDIATVQRLDDLWAGRKRYKDPNIIMPYDDRAWNRKPVNKQNNLNQEHFGAFIPQNKKNSDSFEAFGPQGKKLDVSDAKKKVLSGYDIRKIGIARYKPADNNAEEEFRKKIHEDPFGKSNIYIGERIDTNGHLESKGKEIKHGHEVNNRDRPGHFGDDLNNVRNDVGQHGDHEHHAVGEHRDREVGEEGDHEVGEQGDHGHQHMGLMVEKHYGDLEQKQSFYGRAHMPPKKKKESKKPQKNLGLLLDDDETLAAATTPQTNIMITGEQPNYISFPPLIPLNTRDLTRKISFNGGVCDEFKYPTTTGMLCIHNEGLDLVSDTIRAKGHWDPGMISQIANILQRDPTSTFIDVGAGIGVFSIAAALLKRNVVAVEPFFGNYMMLHKNAAMNHVGDKIKLVTMGLDKESYAGQITFSGKDGGYTNVRIKHLSKEVEVPAQRKVYVTTLDNLIQVVSTKRVVLKIDVTDTKVGDIISGGSHFLQRVSVPFIVTHWDVTTARQNNLHLMETMAKLGYVPRLGWDQPVIQMDHMKKDQTFLVWTKPQKSNGE